MSIFKPKPTDYTSIEQDGVKHRVLSETVYSNFNSSLLNLGDLQKASSSEDVIAAVFDLQGFTNFCKQIEPHLSVPVYLSQFLAWLFKEIKEEMTAQKFKEGAKLWCPLPFFVKFMGDGILALWEVAGASDESRANVIISARNICSHYKQKFLPEISRKVVDPPELLRCGLARGLVYSVGNGSDYVGSCINMAARLQKLNSITFAFNIRGINMDVGNDSSLIKRYIVKKVAIRGIGDRELIALPKVEFDKLKSDDKKQFSEI